MSIINVGNYNWIVNMARHQVMVLRKKMNWVYNKIKIKIFIFFIAAPSAYLLITLEKSQKLQNRLTLKVESQPDIRN